VIKCVRDLGHRNRFVLCPLEAISVRFRCICQVMRRKGCIYGFEVAQKELIRHDDGGVSSQQQEK
jgi:hypothetical protein